MSEYNYENCKTCTHCEVNLWRRKNTQDTYADMCSAPQLQDHMDQFDDEGQVWPHNRHRNGSISAQDCRDLKALCGGAARWYEPGIPRSVDGIGFKKDGTWGSTNPLPDYINRTRME